MGVLELEGLASFVGLVQVMKRRASHLNLSHVVAQSRCQPTHHQQNPSGELHPLRRQRFVEGIEWDLTHWRGRRREGESMKVVCETTSDVL